VQELNLYVHSAVRDWAVSNQKQQTPRFMANIAGDIILSTTPNSATTAQLPLTVGATWAPTQKKQIELQLFQPQWQKGNDESTFVVECRPQESINLVGLAESPNGVAEVKIDGRTLPLGSLGARDLKLVALTRNTKERETQTRFTGTIRAGNSASEIIISIRDATGELRDFRIQLRPRTNAPAGGTPVAVIGLSKRDTDEYEELRTLRVGQGLRQVLSRTVRDVKQISLVEEKSEVLVGLAERQWAQQGAAFDPATAVQAGKLMGAKYVLYGEVYDFASPRENRGKLYIAVQVRLVDVETARIWVGSGEAELVVRPEPATVGEFDRTNLADVSQRAMRAALNDLFTTVPIV
jgi:hypothetical protein